MKFKLVWSKRIIFSMNTYNQRTRSAELTSTGIGHKCVHPPPFHINSKNGPLPLSLQRPRTSVASSFTPTSHMEHNRKPLTGPLVDIKYTLAPPHWKTHTMADLKRRIENCWGLRVLPSLISEARDNYSGQPARIAPHTAHHNELLALYGKLATDRTMAASGAVLSTTHRDHRVFNSSDLTSSYSGQGNSLRQGLTKSCAYSHTAPHKAPAPASCCPRLPHRSVPVPHRAYTSQYRDSFTTLALPHSLPHQPQHMST